MGLPGLSLPTLNAFFDPQNMGRESTEGAVPAVGFPSSRSSPVSWLRFSPGCAVLPGREDNPLFLHMDSF